MQDLVKQFIARHVFHPAVGMTFAHWWELLRRHHFAIDAVQQPRVLIQTALSAANSVNARLEHQIFGRRIDEAIVSAPIFILGHYRSGTTHLHNMLALDPQLAAPTLYQVLNPHTFLLTERWSAPLADRLVIRHRFQDKVAQGAGVASEDEFALATMTGLPPYLAYYFPRDAARYDPYLTMQDVAAAEVALWGRALTTFARKLTLRHGRRLLLKSPPHTARIRLLLGLFPDARFIHIHRHPYEVHPSTKHLAQTVQPAIQLQRCAPLDSEERILRIYSEMYEAYFEQRDLIPAGRLCDVRFADLQRSPIAVIESIYESLGLPLFQELRPRLETYLGSISAYQKNQFAELDEPLKLRIATTLALAFKEWAYER